MGAIPNPAILLCHPCPFPTEGYLGYILRLSENNGYRNPWNLYRLAGTGMRTGDPRTIGLNPAILATMIRGSVSDLQALSYRVPDDSSRRLWLLGHQVSRGHLLLARQKLCPKCVAEKGFIEAHWDLNLMIGCSDHRCLVVEACPACNEPLRFGRPGLLECRCGGDISKSELAPISRDDANLLAIVRAKIVGTSLTGGEIQTLPYRELMAMELRHMVKVLEVLGKHRLTADNSPNVNGEYQIIHAAAQVLKEWPTNFHSLLGDISSGSADDARTVTEGQFGSIYKSLFGRNGEYPPPAQSAFLRHAFIEFAMARWENEFVTDALMMQLRRLDPDRFLSHREWAARAGVCVTTATKYLKRNGRQTLLQWSRDRPTGVVVGENGPIPSVAPGKVFNLREAAGHLGIPRWLLSALKKSGVYESLQRGLLDFGFHEHDVSRFQQKMLGMTSNQRKLSLPRDQCQSVREVLGKSDTSRKTKEKFVHLLFSDELTSVGNEDGTVGGLLVNRADYDNFRDTHDKDSQRNSFTKVEAIKLLDCVNCGIIGHLMDKGLLCGTQTRQNTAIDKDSLQQFSQKYVSLKSVAKQMRVNARIILRYCDHKQVALLFTREGKPRTQSFISVADNAILRATGLPRLLNEVVKATPSYAYAYRPREPTLWHGQNRATLPPCLRRVLERHLSHESDSVEERVG
jgi:hypothetical protein